MSPSVEPFNAERYKALMDGLEAMEIEHDQIMQNKDERMDSAFWTTQIIKNPKLNYRKIGELLENSQYGVSISMNEEEKGYPIYRMNEIHNMLCDLEVDKCAELTIKEKEIFKLKNKDVLFNRTNSYEWVGRTGIYYKNSVQDYVFASYLVRFIPDKSFILPEYLTAFLNTKYGVKAIKARARQSINQTNVNPEEVKEIEIPIVSHNMQKLIETNFVEANQMVVEASKKYEEANNLLLQELGYNELQIDNTVSIKTMSESFLSSGRLDSEYYQPKFEHLENLIKSVEHKPLYEIASVRTGEFVEESEYGEQGISYVRGTDITSTVVDHNSSIKVNIDISNRKTISNGDFAFSLIGSVGNISQYICEELGLVSNNLGSISLHNKENKEYYLLFLSSVIGQMLFEKYQTRTAQPKIRKEDVENFLIPILPMDKQIEISNLVKKSFALKKQAKQLLDNAIKAVEMTIETDEETAIAWLSSQE